MQNCLNVITINIVIKQTISCHNNRKLLQFPHSQTEIKVWCDTKKIELGHCRQWHVDELNKRQRSPANIIVNKTKKWWRYQHTQRSIIKQLDIQPFGKGVCVCVVSEQFTARQCPKRLVYYTIQWPSVWNVETYLRNYFYGIFHVHKRGRFYSGMYSFSRHQCSSEWSIWTILCVQTERHCLISFWYFG